MDIKRVGGIEHGSHFPFDHCRYGGLLRAATFFTLGLRLVYPGYVLAELALAFSLGVKFSRLHIGGLSSVAAGRTVQSIASSGRTASAITGLILLAIFLSYHIPHFPAGTI